VYAIFYGCATLGLLFGSGYVLRIETELKELLEVKAESVGFSKKGKARLSELQLSHSFYVRYECFIFITVTRYAIAAAICAQLIFNDSLQGSMALLLLVMSVLGNTSGLVIFFLFGVGETGVFAVPIERLQAVLAWVAELPGCFLCALLPGATPKNEGARMKHRSVAVDELLEAIDGSATSTGYEVTSHWATVRRAIAVAKIQKYWVAKFRAGNASPRAKVQPQAGYLPPTSALTQAISDSTKVLTDSTQAITTSTKRLFKAATE